MIARLRIYWRVWRVRGAATLNHWLWAYWALTGKYPTIAAAAQRAETRSRLGAIARQSGGVAASPNLQHPHQDTHRENIIMADAITDAMIEAGVCALVTLERDILTPD